MANDTTKVTTIPAEAGINMAYMQKGYAIENLYLTIEEYQRISNRLSTDEVYRNNDIAIRVDNSNNKTLLFVYGFIRESILP